MIGDFSAFTLAFVLFVNLIIAAEESKKEYKKPKLDVKFEKIMTFTGPGRDHPQKC